MLKESLMPVFRLKNISKESFETDLAVFCANNDTDLFDIKNGYFFKRSTNRSKGLSTNGKIKITETGDPDILTCSISFEPKNLHLDLLKIDIFILILFIAGILYSKTNLPCTINWLMMFIVSSIFLVILGYFGIKSEQGTFIRLFRKVF